MKTILLTFGTRPEAIKMAPLVLEMKKRKDIHTLVAVTGQHRQMLDQVLEVFHIVPDYDLSIMRDKQTLFDITTNVLNGMRELMSSSFIESFLFCIIGIAGSTLSSLIITSIYNRRVRLIADVVTIPSEKSKLDWIIKDKNICVVSEEIPDGYSSYDSYVILLNRGNQTLQMKDFSLNNPPHIVIVEGQLWRYIKDTDGNTNSDNGNNYLIKLLKPKCCSFALSHTNSIELIVWNSSSLTVSGGKIITISQLCSIKSLFLVAVGLVKIYKISQI